MHFYLKLSKRYFELSVRGDSMFKSLKQFFGVYLGTLVFIIALIIIASSAKIFLPDNDIAKIPVEVMMAILSAALAGAFTILGVEKTLREQNKDKFISEFPIKIFHLDHLLEEITLLKDEITEIMFFFSIKTEFYERFIHNCYRG